MKLKDLLDLSSLVKLRRIHLPSYEEFYTKTRNRVGRLLEKHKKLKRRDVRKEALEIIDTAYNVISSKLDNYIEFQKIITKNPLLMKYLEVTLGSGYITKLEEIRRLKGKLRYIWLTIRRQLKYQPEEGIKREALKGVSRLLSVIKRNRKVLEEALKIKKEAVLMPGLGLMPPVIITGPPNAGKSTLAKRISRIKTEVRAYPFTTKRVLAGTTESIIKGLSIHVLDTPGILPRDYNERNIVEKRTLAVMNLPYSIVVFLIDPTKNSAVPIDEQLELLKEIMNRCPNIIVAINKVDEDLESALKVKEIIEDEFNIKAYLISALKGEGVDKLIDEVRKIYTEVSKAIVKAWEEEIVKEKMG